MSNEINIEELERLAKELINSAPWTSQHRDLSIVFAVTMSPDGVLSLIDRLKKAEAEVEQFRTDARRFRLAEKNLFDAQEAAKTIAKQAIAAEAERDALAAKLKEVEGQTDNLLSACHRLALELECLLLDTKDSASVSRWWDSAMAALDEWHKVKDSVSAEQPWSPTRLATWCACNDPAKQRQPRPEGD